MFPWTKGQLKSCGNVNTHAPGITGTLMFFLFLSRLYYASKGCFSHVCSLLIGQLGRVKHRDTALVSFVLYYSPPPCSCLCPFSCSPDHCWQQTSLPTAGAVLLFFFFCLCCWRLLSELKLDYIFRKAPWRVILEPCMLGWCRLSQGSGFSKVADHLELQAADRSLLADKSAAQHH